MRQRMAGLRRADHSVWSPVQGITTLPPWWSWLFSRYRCAADRAARERQRLNIVARDT